MLCHCRTGPKKQDSIFMERANETQTVYIITFLTSAAIEAMQPAFHPPARGCLLLPITWISFMMDVSLWKWLPVLYVLAPSVTQNLIIFICLPLYLLSVDTVISGLVSSFSDLMMAVFIPHKSREAKFAEHYTAVGQQRTVLPELSIKIQHFL